MGFDKLEAARRRRLIAEICAKGLHKHYSLRELSSLLSSYEEPSTNRGQPWSYETIRQDIEAITLEWQQDAVKGLGQHRAEMAAQLSYITESELQRPEPNFAEVRQSILAKAKILGVDGDQLVVFELVRVQMDMGAKRLRAEFADEPELLARAFRALSGQAKMIEPLPD